MMQAGSRVVVYESHDRHRALTLKPGDVLHNRFGRFPHDRFIGKPFGSKIESLEGTGHIYALQFTPELWTMALTHRTQILYDADIAAICHALDLRPGSVVVEAGTGSGSLTHSLARAVAPHGKVFTFEFHAQRAQQAREEFVTNGIADVVRIEQRDVCGNGLPSDLPAVDAVFWDLPDATQAIPEALRVLRPGGRICCFCPSTEQTLRVCNVLRSSGFISVETVETITRRFDVRVHTVNDIKFGAAEPLPHQKSVLAAAAMQADPLAPAAGPAVLPPPAVAEAASGGDSGATGGSAAAAEGEGSAVQGPIVSADAASVAVAPAPAVRRQRTGTRLFPDMRGHTGYLTFATRLPRDEGEAAAAAAAASSAGVRAPSADASATTAAGPAGTGAGASRTAETAAAPAAAAGSEGVSS